MYLGPEVSPVVPIPGLCVGMDNKMLLILSLLGFPKNFGKQDVYLRGSQNSQAQLTAWTRNHLGGFFFFFLTCENLNSSTSVFSAREGEITTS